MLVDHDERINVGTAKRTTDIEPINVDRWCLNQLRDPDYGAFQLITGNGERMSTQT